MSPKPPARAPAVRCSRSMSVVDEGFLDFTAGEVFKDVAERAFHRDDAIGTDPPAVVALAGHCHISNDVDAVHL